MSEEINIKFYDAEVEELRKENQQLKEKMNEYRRLGFKHLQEKRNELEQENKQLKLTNQALSGCLKIDKEKIDYYVDRCEQLEKVLDEIRECIDKFPCIHYASAEKVDGKRLSGKLIPTDDLLQILDKVKE